MSTTIAVLRPADVVMQRVVAAVVVLGVIVGGIVALTATDAETRSLGIVAVAIGLPIGATVLVAVAERVHQVRIEQDAILLHRVLLPTRTIARRDVASALVATLRPTRASMPLIRHRLVLLAGDGRALGVATSASPAPWQGRLAEAGIACTVVEDDLDGLERRARRSTRLHERRWRTVVVAAVATAAALALTLTRLA